MGSGASAKPATAPSEKSVESTTLPSLEELDKTTVDATNKVSFEAATAPALAPEEHVKTEDLADPGDSRAAASLQRGAPEAKNESERPDADAAAGIIKVEGKPLKTDSSAEQEAKVQSVPQAAHGTEHEVSTSDAKSAKTRGGYGQSPKKYYNMLFGSKAKASKNTPSDDTILFVKPAQGALAIEVVEGKVLEDTPADGDIQLAAKALPEKAKPEENNKDAKDSSKEASDEMKDKGSSKGFFAKFLPSKTNQAKLKAEASVSVENQESHEAPAVAA